jgi:hypothetical protein
MTFLHKSTPSSGGTDVFLAAAPAAAEAAPVAEVVVPAPVDAAGWATAARRDGGWSGAQPRADSKRTRKRRQRRTASAARDSGLEEEEGEGSWKPVASAALSTPESIDR